MVHKFQDRVTLKLILFPRIWNLSLAFPTRTSKMKLIWQESHALLKCLIVFESGAQLLNISVCPAVQEKTATDISCSV